MCGGIQTSVSCKQQSTRFLEVPTVPRGRGEKQGGPPNRHPLKEDQFGSAALEQQVQSQQRVKHLGQLCNECLVSLANEYQVDTRARATVKGMTSLNLICIAMRCHKGIKSETAMLFLIHALFCCDMKQTAF